MATDDPSRCIRVVYLDHVAKLSGGEIALLRLLPHLAEVEPHVILGEDGPLVQRLVDEGIHTEIMPMGRSARDFRKSRVSVRGLGIGPIVSTLVYIVRLASRLRRLGPDLVHTNSLKAGVYGSVAGRLAGVPVVWHVRDRITDDYLPKSAARLVQSMLRHLPTLVLANSRATMATLDQKGQARAVIHSVIPETLSAPPSRREPPARPFTVGMVGRLAPWKGQTLFLRGFADAFPVGETRCVLVGSAMFGEDDYAAGLHDLAGDLAIEDRVEFRGFRSDIWEELARLDVLVHASLTPEPFGQVILEGLAAQIPVIAAAAGGPAEIIRHDVNGLLYRPGDQAALASGLTRLSSDPELRARLVEGGLASLGPYRPEQVAGRLQDEYRRTLLRYVREKSGTHRTRGSAR